MVLIRMLFVFISLLLLNDVQGHATRTQQDYCVMNTTYPNYLPWTIFPNYQRIEFSFPSPNSVPPVTYNGTTEIDFDVGVYVTSCIVLRASADMTFSFVGLKSGRGVSFSHEQDSLVVTLLEGIFFPGTKDTLEIAFVATVVELPADHYGLFRCDNSASGIKEMLSEENVRLAAEAWRSKKQPRRFSNAKFAAKIDGENMFATQFEQYDARRAFPCFDEPAFKSFFAYNITVPKEFLALANTPATSTVTSGNTTTYFFADTEIAMSTYLVAVAVGRFDVVQQSNVRVFSPVGTQNMATYALGEAVAYKNYFSQQFHIPYEVIGAKMDLIAVSGFAYDAEENIGLMTFFPAMLLVAPDGSIHAKDLISQVVSHEITHQWCGDAYTAPNFNQLYMQEGTARFLQYVAVDAIHPEYNVWNQTSDDGPIFGDTSYITFTYLTALLADFRGISQPPVVLDLNQDAQGTTFYEKGAAINRQFMLSIGLQNFFKGIQNHVTRFFQGNPDYVDFVTSFAQVISDPKLIDKWVPWLLQKSFPVIKVRRTQNLIVLSQSPCAATQNYTIWAIPNLQIDEYDAYGHVLATYWVDLLGPNLTIPLKNPSTIFALVNANSTVFSITSYGNDLMSWVNLYAILLGNDYARNLLLAEMFMLHMQGHIDASPLEMFVMGSWTIEQKAVLLHYFDTIINPPIRYCYNTEQELFLEIALQTLFQVGWTGSDPSGARSTATFMAVYLGSQNSTSTAYQFYNSGSIPSDIQNAVLLAVAIRNPSLLNLSDTASLTALAQSSKTQTMCDSVGKALQNYPVSDMDSISAVLSAAFKHGTCQPRGQLWQFVTMYNISSVFSGAFASTDAINAISSLAFLSDLQKANEIILIQQNMLFCSRTAQP